MEDVKTVSIKVRHLVSLRKSDYVTVSKVGKFAKADFSKALNPEPLNLEPSDRRAQGLRTKVYRV